MENNIITEEGLDSIINDLYNGSNKDIKEVDSLLKKYYDKLQGENGEVNDTALTIYGEPINRLLTNKYSARDQLFKVANLIKDRIKRKSEVNELDDVLNIHDLKKILFKE